MSRIKILDKKNIQMYGCLYSELVASNALIILFLWYCQEYFDKIMQLKRL